MRAMPVARLSSLVLIGVLAALVGCSGPSEPDGTSRRTLREMSAFLDTLANTEFAAQPERATWIGIPDGQIATDPRWAFNDRSQAGFERRRLDRLDTLHAMDRVALPATGNTLRMHFDIARTAHSHAAAAGTFGHGRVSLKDVRPYAADHESGFYLEGFLLLALRQPLRTPSDADAFVTRFATIPDAVEDERRRLIADAQAGIVPPLSILERMDVAAANAVAVDPETGHAMVATFDGWLGAVDGLSDGDRARLTESVGRIFKTDIRPAYVRYRATVRGLALDAPDALGVWQLPNGEAYYDAALTFHASRTIDPDSLGTRARRALDTASAALREAVARPVEETDTLNADAETEPAVLAPLTALVAERIAEAANASASPPSTDLPPSPLDLLKTRLAAQRAPSDLPSPALLTPPVLVELPAYASPEGPVMTYLPPSRDGTSPGAILLSKRPGTAEEVALLTPGLAGLGLPGLHAAYRIHRDTGLPPLIHAATGHTAFEQGWAAYSVSLLDPPAALSLEDVGALQNACAFAATAAIDVGVHTERLARDAAADLLEISCGTAREAALRTVDTVAATPGRAAAAFYGFETLEALKVRAEGVLQDGFDRAAFHRVVLAPGPRPLDAVEADVEAWYSAQLGR